MPDQPDQDRPDSRTSIEQAESDGRDPLDVWEAMEPPEGFAERVLAARRAAAPGASDGMPGAAPELVHDEAGQPGDSGHGGPAPRLWWGRFGTSRPALIASAAVVVASAAVLIVGLRQSSTVPAVSGQARPEQRATVALGRRGVAVVEAGAELAWRVAADGGAAVEQQAGDVFYRVDRGGAFTVHTPVADISVQGTCFRVEMQPMKLSKQAVIGAAAGAALVVTVYEGRVLLGNDQGRQEAGPGQTVIVSAAGQPPALRPDHAVAGARSGDGAGDEAGDRDGAPAMAALAMDPAPPGDISRDDLLARDQSQREQIARLRAEVAAMERDLRGARAGGPGGGDGLADGEAWFDPSPETLQRYARECRVHYDVPPVGDMKPLQLTARAAERFGLSADEIEPVNQALAQIHARWRESVRALYVEATGDAAGADTLSPMAMAREIEDKSMPGEGPRIQKRIAWERAGLMEPPADSSQAVPLERYFRMLSTVGDELEAMLAGRLGPERARQMRERNNGWGQRMAFAGCPDDDAADGQE